MSLVLIKSIDFTQGTLNLAQTSWDQSRTVAETACKAQDYTTVVSGWQPQCNTITGSWSFVLKIWTGHQTISEHTLSQHFCWTSCDFSTRKLPHYPLLLPHLERDCFKCPLFQSFHSGPPGLQTTKRKAPVKTLVLLSEARSLCTDVTLLGNLSWAWALSIHGRLEEEWPQTPLLIQGALPKHSVWVWCMKRRDIFSYWITLLAPQLTWTSPFCLQFFTFCDHHWLSEKEE